MKIRKNSILKDWSISYTLILLVPLITIFVNFYHSTGIIKEEIMQAHELILENLSDNIDRIMEEERGMFLYFSGKAAFREIVSSASKDADFYYKSSEFSLQLKEYGTSKNNMSYWLYMEDKDYIVYSGGGDSNRNVYFSQRMLIDEMPEYDQWKSFLSGKYTNDYFIYDGLYNNYGNKSLIFANSYYNNNQQMTNIFVTVPVSMIEELTESLPSESLLMVYFGDERESLEERLLVIDSEGVRSVPENIDITPIVDGERDFEIAEYVGISADAEHGKATYFLLVPQEAFWNDLRDSRDRHLVSLLITLLVGIGLITFLLKKNFHPVFSLLGMIESDNHELNEFKKIEYAYNVIRQENNTIKKAIQAQEKSLVSSYLLSMLKGRMTKIGSREQESALDLSFHGTAVALVGIYVPLKYENEPERDELSFFIVDNVFSELMEGEKFYQIEDGRFIFYLFCVDNGQIPQWQEKCLKNANFLCDFLEEKFKMNLPVAISAVEADISQIKYMYQRVMEAFEYKRVIGGGGVITTAELQDAEESDQRHDCHVMLAQALENGNLKEAYRASKQLFLNTEHTPFIVLRLKILEAFQVVVDRYSVYIVNPARRKKLLSWLDALLNAKDAESMKKQFDDMLAFACEKMSAQWEEESSGIVKNIREYVEANYADCNLNLNSISAALQRNPRYLSNVFKEETGDGILDYINELRISKARELLAKGTYSVEEVGGMVGYASIRTFRRTFSKIVGTTPGNFS